MFLPHWFPLNIYDFASWARATIVPMLIILTERPICPVPESARIDELYPAGRGRDRLLASEAEESAFLEGLLQRRRCAC